MFGRGFLRIFVLLVNQKRNIMEFPKFKAARFVMKLVDENFFDTNDRIQLKKEQRNRAALKGQNVSQYTDAYIEREIRSYDFKEAYIYMAVRVYRNALNKDLEALTKHLHYHNKKSLQLFKMYTGIDLGTTNKVIRQRLIEYCKQNNPSN